MDTGPPASSWQDLRNQVLHSTIRSGSETGIWRKLSQKSSRVVGPGCREVVVFFPNSFDAKNAKCESPFICFDESDRRADYRSDLPLMKSAEDVP